MRRRIPIFLNFLLINFVASFKPLPGVDNDIIDTFIKKHVDLSLDPCDDFYRHVCNRHTTANFQNHISKIEKAIEKARWNTHQYGNITKLHLDGHEKIFRKLRSRDQFVGKLCNRKTLKFFQKLVGDQRGRYNCRQIFEKVRKLENTLKSEAYLLTKIARQTLVYDEISFVDKIARDLFAKIIAEMRKLIKSTKWITSKKVTKHYLKALEDIKLFTFHNFKRLAADIMDSFGKYKEECYQMLYRVKDQEALCKIYAIHYANAPLNQSKIVLDTFTNSEIIEILAFPQTVFNAQDKNIMLGNSFLILSNSKYASSFYGSIGYTLAHELMHTFVFDEHDKKAKLYKYWSDDTECIQAQSRKTCKTFRTAACDPTRTHHATFEEDGADYFGYHLIHKLFQTSNIERKRKIDSIDSLNKDQLFFYGAAALFCDTKAFTNRHHADQMHTNEYQRINSLASQIEGFASAFQCKLTDRMVRNRAETCDIYGGTASNKSPSDGSDIDADYENDREEKSKEKKRKTKTHHKKSKENHRSVNVDYDHSDYDFRPPGYYVVEEIDYGNPDYSNPDY